MRLRLAVADSWLVGGPGAGQQDLEARWVEVRLHLPLDDGDGVDGSDGSTEIVLHEARAFGVPRETWTVTADAGGVLPRCVCCSVRSWPGWPPPHGSPACSAPSGCCTTAASTRPPSTASSTTP